MAGLGEFGKDMASGDEWGNRQRSFQARLQNDPDVDFDVRSYVTFEGAPGPVVPGRLGRVERTLVLVVLAAVIVGSMFLVGAPRPLVAMTAGLFGGLVLFFGLAGPGGTDEHATGPDTTLVAIYSAAVKVGDRPQCVAAISAADRHRLGPCGTGSVVGVARPGGSLGVFIDDHLVWPAAPPRRPTPSDPRF